MTNATKLADRIVALGVGRSTSFDEYWLPDEDWSVSADEFIAGPRVAMALLIECRKAGFSWLLHTMPDGKAVMTIQAPISNDQEYADPSKCRSWAAQVIDDNDCIAINTACADALEGKDG
jgi:hypothetical protein